MESKDLTGQVAPVRLSSTGRLCRIVGLQLTFKCRMWLLLFPYDQQTCSVKVATMMQRRNKIRLSIVEPDLSNANEPLTKYMVGSNEFCVQNLTLRLHTASYYEFAEYRLTYQRMSTFYLVSLILPSLLLLVISTLAFCLPPECGERVSFSVTIVLSMCVFLQLTGNYTPTQSESVPLLTCYYSLAVAITIANVVGNVFVLHCHYRETRGDQLRVRNQIVRLLFLNRLFTSAASVGDSATGQACNEWGLVKSVADRCFFVILLSTNATIVLALIAVEAANSTGVCLGDPS